MKPYRNKNIPLDQRIFNYRLSRARSVIENTFGIATTRFRIFRRPIIANLDKVILITQAIVAGFRPGDWRKDNLCSAALQPLTQSGSNNYSKTNYAKLETSLKNTLIHQKGNWDGN